MAGDSAEIAGASIAENLRDFNPELRLLVNAGSGSIKSQLKRADKSGAAFALILGESEVNSQEITIKPLLENLQKDFQQQTLPQNMLGEFVAKQLMSMI